MKVLNVKVENSTYNIYVGQSIENKIAEYTKKYDSILLLTNTKVGKLYGDKILDAVPNAKYFEIPDGEEYKCYSTVEKIYDFMVKNKFYRKSVIVSLGGGVVCDIAGYVASSYMRGIDFVQVPTSLLAQVDASVGGKVAINHGESKNLIGAFYQPKAVIIDINFLQTLDEKQFLSGMGEVIKHSIITSDDKILKFLESKKDLILARDSKTLQQMVYDSCKIKKEIVEADERENGVRAFLNLGHTYGHAAESLFDFKGITHGEGVAKGILFEILISRELNPKNKNLDIVEERVKNIFAGYNLNSKINYFDNKKLLEAMSKDKKNTKEGTSFICIDDFGKLENKIVTNDIIESVNKKLKSELKAVIDIGTNSVRLFICEVDNKLNKVKKTFEKKTIITSLGRDVDKTKQLRKDRIEATVEALVEYKKIANEYGIKRIKAIATSAVRDSENREEFLNKVKKLGIDVECIPGELEARLSFIGISSVYQNEIIGIIDIGGGSTEFSVGKSGEAKYLKSFNVGAVRVTEKFLSVENYSAKNISEAKKWLKKELKELEQFKNKKIKWFGVAGTVTTHVSVTEKMLKYNTKKVNGYALTRDDIEKNFEEFKSKTFSERQKIIGLQPKRAEFVVGGSLVLLTIMELLGKDTVIVSEVDNLDGAAILF